MKLSYWLFLILFLALHTAAAGKTLDHYAQGRELYLAGQYPEALTLYQKALKGGQKKWLTLQAIGDTYWAMGQKDEGVRYYRMSLKAHPNNPKLKNFLNPPVEPPAASRETQTASNSSPKILEFSITGGHATPLQTDHYTVNWDMGWEASLFLGVRIFDHLSLGVHGEGLCPSNYYQYQPLPPLNPNQWYGSRSQTAFAGTLCLDAHVYPISAAGNFPVYLVGGGGVYIQHLSSQQSFIYNTSNYTYTPFDIPPINILAPTLQWGLGIPFGGPTSKLLLECRMAYVFAVDPIYYVTFNAGGLIFF